MPVLYWPLYEAVSLAICPVVPVLDLLRGSGCSGILTTPEELAELRAEAGVEPDLVRRHREVVDEDPVGPWQCPARPAHALYARRPARHHHEKHGTESTATYRRLHARSFALRNRR